MSLEELRRALKEEKVVFGTKETLRNLKKGKLKKVFVSGNCPKNLRDDIKHFSKIAKIDVVELTQPDDELALLCKKNFSVSVLSY